jgi:hypothetical protein
MPRAGPALQEREGGAPPPGLLELGFAFLSKLLQLVARHHREEPRFQGGGELEGQAQVRMSRRKRQNLGPDVPFDTGAAEQVEQLETGLDIPAGLHERLPDELDQALQRTRRRVEMPRAHIPLLQNDRASLPEQPEVRGELVWRTTQRCDLEPCVDEVERRRVELAREEVVLHECDVAEALRLHELCSGGEHCVADIRSHHLAVRADPLAQQSEPTDRTASDVQGAGAATLADLVEKPAAARLPHP